LKAAVYRKYGPPDVLHIENVEKPVPKDNQVLVRVHATTVCAGDVRFRKADPFFLRWLNGIRRPKKINILGMEVAGTIERVGESVSGCRIGDEVFGSTGLKFGAYAEYACIAEGPLLALRSANVNLETAAAIPFGGVSALHFLRKANLRAGQTVLIYGASGSVGTFAVQLAKYFGAHVTGVCSTRNLDLVRSLGADDVIDYTKNDFSKNGRVYDVIFDTVGKSGFWRSVRSLKRGGSYVFAASGLLAPTLGRLWATLTGAGQLIGGIARMKAGDLRFLMDLVETGKMQVVIHRRYPLDRIAEANRYVETGHKRGNVVVTVAASSG
jgi:NADPH:quinone reductase-like Zn-dependent oxidoreductase